MPRPDETVTLPLSTPVKREDREADATLAGDGTLDIRANNADAATLASDATLGGDSGSDGRTLGDGTFADEPEATVDAERTLFDRAAASGDRTLAGDNAGESFARDDATFMDDPTLEEDRTLAEESPRKRHRAPLEQDTFNDPSVAVKPTAQDRADDRTLAGDDFSDGAVHDDDRTLMDAPARQRDADPDATIAGDDMPRANDDRTLMDDGPGAGIPADDRTVAGDACAARNEADDRTQAGDAAEDSSRRPDGRTHAGAPREPARAYDLLEDFARGGMGKIWRAMDLRIHREVAYKELLPNALKNPVVVERFLKEAQVTGQLEHPGIVPIYDLGWQDNGTPFYSMKLVRGTTFKKPIEEYHALPRGSSARRMAFVKLLQQFVAICNTLGYSHERNVLHRDLKPLNVMVGDFGETLVLDWGLARLMNDPDSSPMGDGPFPDEEIEGDGTVALDDVPPRAGDNATEAGNRGGATQHGASQGGATQGGTQAGQTTGARRQSVVTDFASEGSRTLMGSVMGTPAYMPPEQARGLHDQLDGRSDLYSLGAILYEILTNRAPIRRGKLPEMLKAVVDGAIEPPRKIDPSIPKPLEAVCLKALAKDKKDRYGSTMELAREVERYVADEPVTAYPEPWHVRAGRWIRRHPTLVSTATSVIILAIAGFWTWSAVETRRVAGIERSARERISESKSAIAASGESYEKLEGAAAPLREAAALVESEPRLASLQIEIRNDLDDLARDVAMRRDSARERIKRVAADAMQRADRLIAGENALNKALNELQEISAALSPWPELADLKATIEARKAALRTQIAQQEAKDAAQTKFERFLSEVDQARFFGSFFSEGSVEEHSKSAQQHGLAALKLYGIDQPGAAVPRPELLSEEQQKEIVEGSFEVLMILADTEMKLAGEATPESQKAGAEKALVWLERAKALPIVSKVLPYREHLAWTRLGDKEKAEQAREVRDQRKAATALDCYLLGQEVRHFGSLDEALDWYQQALQLDPKYFWALQNIGLCHLRQGRPEAAVSAYTAAIAARPEESICYLTRAIAFGDLKHDKLAQADFKKAEELGAVPYELVLNRGNVAHQSGDFEAAIRDFEAAAKMRPETAGPHKNLGNTLYVQAEGIAKGANAPERALPVFERALDALTTALEKEPDNSVAYSIRGEVLLRLEKNAEATADFVKAAQFARNAKQGARAWAEVGRINHRASRLPQALAAYDRSLAAYASLLELDERTPATDEEESGIHRLRAEVLRSMNRLDEAEAAWSKALALGKPVGDIYRGRGLSRATRGQYREAMSDYTRALELEPSSNMLIRRGWAYLLQANRLAIADFAEAIEKNPEDPDAWNGRGYARVLMGDVAGAVADADEAVQRDKAVTNRRATWENLFNSATIYAQAVDRTEKDKSKSDEDRVKISDELTAKAIETLRAAGKAAGPKGEPPFLETVKAEAALDPIRQKPEFVELFGPKPAPKKE